MPEASSGADYRVRAVSLWEPETSDLSDAPFTIEAVPSGEEQDASAGRNAVGGKRWPFYE